MNQTQVMIVGAGPIGVELAAALARANVDFVHVDAGQMGQTITWYPRQVKFFSSPERISLAGLPLHTSDQSKATREEYLAYLRGVVEHYDLKIQTYERVTKIEPAADKPGSSFTVHTQRGGDTFTYRVKQVVLAIGDMHRPRLLHIPGEEMKHVSHYFDEPHRYFQQKLLIVGGRNSAIEAAIRCFRAGAHVTVSYRGHSLDDSAIKYWLLPEFNWLVKHGHIKFHPGTIPTQITRTHVTLNSVSVKDVVVAQIEADFVLLLTGYEMDTSLLSAAGVKLGGPNNAPILDETTMQTNVPGLFVAGTAAAGTQIKFRLFIENCHAHVEKIAAVITGDPKAGVFKRTGSMRKADIEQMPES